MEGTDISEGDEVRKNNLEFAKDLGEINAVMARMAQTSSVGFIREVNRNLTAPGDGDDTSVQIFTMLSTQRAIWTDWRDVLYAWAGATTLDFAPLFFMVLLAIAYDRQHAEQPRTFAAI